MIVKGNFDGKGYSQDPNKQYLVRQFYYRKGEKNFTDVLRIIGDYTRINQRESPGRAELTIHAQPLPNTGRMRITINFIGRESLLEELIEALGRKDSA